MVPPRPLPVRGDNKVDIQVTDPHPDPKNRRANSKDIQADRTAQEMGKGNKSQDSTKDSDPVIPVVRPPSEVLGTGEKDFRDKDFRRDRHKEFRSVPPLPSFHPTQF